MKYITMIDSFYPSLSKTEKTVADYVKKEKDQIIYQTLQEISKNINVGEATILRFCYKIGFDGFQDLKLNIAKEEPNPDQSVEGDYIEQVTANITRSITETKAVLDMENLEAAVDLMVKGKRIVIYGIGASGNAAQELESRLLRSGKITHAVIDNHFQLMTSSILSEEDVIIAFSLSGSTLELVDSLNMAKKNNVNIIAVTNHILSPVASLADVVLLTAGKESPMNGGSLTGKISQLYIIDLLITGYSLRDPQLTAEMRERTALSILDKTVEHNKRKNQRRRKTNGTTSAKED
ncbi:MurR/RpiR family transcriptional regulator [Proteiniclasticum sp. C24MP]|uniref:MurR/RpiR family transcriptional regulator n=1 Tax=Proteiniclasticum sp. C24MP TaxID=3374101 RepID=UPI003754DAD0